MKLGDAVATVAQPIARGLDATVGPSGMGFYRTPIETCASCGGRQATLNRWGDKFYDQFVYGKDNREETNRMPQYIITINKLVDASSPEEAVSKVKDAETISLYVNPRPPQPQAPQMQVPQQTAQQKMAERTGK